MNDEIGTMQNVFYILMEFFSGGEIARCIANVLTNLVGSSRNQVIS